MLPDSTELSPLFYCGNTNISGARGESRMIALTESIERCPVTEEFAYVGVNGVRGIYISSIAASYYEFDDDTNDSDRRIP
jgi:hypothetical protein